eukprot:Lithocolla_globosa_v1_NODE_207_length_5169_cov_7.885329.p2 type:complete len:282 gc:universal NODE_207_length_5169_cov_7.885329:314-1159(+)
MQDLVLDEKNPVLHRQHFAESDFSLSKTGSKLLHSTSLPMPVNTSVSLSSPNTRSSSPLSQVDSSERVGSASSVVNENTSHDTSSPQKRKRQRDPLAETAHQLRYKVDKHVHHELPSPFEIAENEKKKKEKTSKALQTAREIRLETHEALQFLNEKTVSQKVGRKSTLQLSSRRYAIVYFWEIVLGSPPENEWDGKGGVVWLIIRALGIPSGSHVHVRDVLKTALYDMEEGLVYDPNKKYGNSGRIPTIGFAGSNHHLQCSREGIRRDLHDHISKRVQGRK